MLLEPDAGTHAVALQEVADANKEEMTTFWDNDSLAALLGVELRADLVMLMTDVNGLFTGPPKEPSSE